MPSAKKVIFLALTLVVLLGGALILWKTSRPVSDEKNRLRELSIQDISRLVLSMKGQSVTVELSSNTWHITAPFKDYAEPLVMESLVRSVSELSIGSVISEKTDKYPQFELDEDHAVRVTAYAKDPRAPALDVYLGKQGNIFGEAYGRLEGETAIRQVSRCQTNSFKIRPDDFRMKALFLPHSAQIHSLKIHSPAGYYSFSFSSPTWRHEVDGKVVDESWIQMLTVMLRRWESSGLVGKNNKEPFGYEKPFWKVTLAGDSFSSTVIVGQPALKGATVATTLYYAHSQGREGDFLIDGQRLESVRSYLKTLR